MGPWTKTVGSHIRSKKSLVSDAMRSKNSRWVWDRIEPSSRTEKNRPSGIITARAAALSLAAKAWKNRSAVAMTAFSSGDGGEVQVRKRVRKTRVGKIVRAFLFLMVIMMPCFYFRRGRASAGINKIY